MKSSSTASLKSFTRKMSYSNKGKNENSIGEKNSPDRVSNFLDIERSPEIAKESNLNSSDSNKGLLNIMKANFKKFDTSDSD
jgi:hypothetical protein